MQNWLDENDILMYTTHNEGTSVFAERFVITLKGKIYKRMKANDSNSYLSYLNKLVDQYNNTYQRYIDKNPIGADNPNLAKEIESIHKAPRFKFGDRESGVLRKKI